MYELLNIPKHDRCQNCGECCGLIPATPEEITAIQEYLANHSLVLAKVRGTKITKPLMCPFRDEKAKSCMIYAVRPMVCRLMGVVEGARCLHGNSHSIDGGLFLKEHMNFDNLTLLNILEW